MTTLCGGIWGVKEKENGDEPWKRSVPTQEFSESRDFENKVTRDIQGTPQTTKNLRRRGNNIRLLPADGMRSYVALCTY